MDDKSFDEMNNNIYSSQCGNENLRLMRNDARNDDRYVRSNAALYMNRGHDQDAEDAEVEESEEPGGSMGWTCLLRLCRERQAATYVGRLNRCWRLLLHRLLVGDE